MKLSKQMLLSATMVALNCSMTSAIPTTSGMYDMRPKNHFRGGSKGKGGKIKYPRR